MKKLLCLFLALLMTLSLGSVVAMAEEDPIQITIDGVKDEDYTDTKMLDYTNWQFWDNIGQNNFEPVDYERVKNTVWFNWDDTHVYIYFQCESKDNLYKPGADVTSIPDFDLGDFYEMAQIYLDTAPSMDYDGACNWAGQDGNGDTCAHISCNCRGGSGSYYRLMARANPAFNEWNDYYASASGIFMDYNTFSEKYAGREGYEDMQAAYAAAHGTDGSQAVSFIDYTTNTYGFELKFPRPAEEEYFKINIRTRVNEIVWDEYGPELPYSLSFCKAWWLNSDEMIPIWYSDYVEDVPAEVMALRRMREELPGLDGLTIEYKDALEAVLNAYNALTDDAKKHLTDEEVEFFTKAQEKMGKLEYLANLGDVNSDGKVNSNDALVALRVAVGKTTLDEAATLRGEVTGDGVVNAKDALEMLQFTVGKRTEFTIARTVEL